MRGVGGERGQPALHALPLRPPTRPPIRPPTHPPTRPPQVIATDLPACQAVIHVVDAVLVPESKPDAKAALMAMFQH